MLEEDMLDRWMDGWMEGVSGGGAELCAVYYLPCQQENNSLFVPMGYRLL